MMVVAPDASPQFRFVDDGHFGELSGDSTSILAALHLTTIFFVL